MTSFPFSFNTSSSMTNIPKPNIGSNSNTNQVPLSSSSNPVATNMFSFNSSTVGNTLISSQSNPFSVITPKPMEKPLEPTSLPFFPNTRINNPNASSTNPFSGLVQNIPISNTAQNSQKGNNEQTPANNPFTDHTSQKTMNILPIANQPISGSINPKGLTDDSNLEPLMNKEKKEKEEVANAVDKPLVNTTNDNKNLTSDSLLGKNPIGLQSQMTFEPNTLIKENSKKEETQINTDVKHQDPFNLNKTEENNKINNDKGILFSSSIDMPKKEKEPSLIKQNSDSEIKKDNDKDINNNHSNKEKEKEKMNSILDSTLSNLPNAKIEETFTKWKNDLEYQAEKYSLCSERLKNYELQFESEIESISILTNLIQTIQVNSDETVSQLKDISSKEDELLSQLNFMEQSLQSYSQEISSNTNKDQDTLYNDITELSKKINHIGNTIDDINQRSEPLTDDKKNQSNINIIRSKNSHSEEGEMNKILNEFYYELRKIESAEQALLSKLNNVEKDIDYNKIDIALKKTTHY